VKLEKADQYAEGNQATRMEARSFMAAIKAGAKCSRCSQPATSQIGGVFLCRLDAQVAKQRRERERMRRA
jgi:hypothetical protein